MRLLLGRGANVNAQDDSGHTSLHLAIRNGHRGVVQLLLGNNPNTNIANRVGWTALHQAAETGDEAILGLLIDHGADLHQRVVEG